MPIKANCSCGFGFAVKDEFAEKRVKCPKCGTAVSIGPLSAVQKPAAKTQDSDAGRTVQNATRAVGSGATLSGSKSKNVIQSPPKQVPPKADRIAKTNATNGGIWNAREKFNPVLDLLDEAGVKALKSGPVCPNCEAEMSPTAVICVHCGFNKDTGERLETFSDVRNEHETNSTFVESDTERLLAKAEREIKDAPNSVLNQDFGDGSDSIVVALGALLGFGLIIVAGVMTVLLMDRLADQVNPARISFFSSTAIVIGCMLFITYNAFRAGVVHGIMCILTIQYCVIFAFMQGRSLVAYGIIMQVALIIATITGFITFGT